MIRILAVFPVVLLAGCISAPATSNTIPQVQAGAGQYVRPAFLNPAPTPMIPPVDACRSRLYTGLIGRPEGSIYISGLPSPKRVIKPAFNEGFGYGAELGSLAEFIPFKEVRDYLPDQSLYAPSIRTVSDEFELGPAQEDRLTIELDAEGIVQEIRCG